MTKRKGIRIEILDPPKYFDIGKTITQLKGGKLKQGKRHYLTGNLFFNTNRFTLKEIKQRIRALLYPHFKNVIIPIDWFPVDIEVIYERPKGVVWDLDNRGYFWQKIMLDLIKKHKNNTLSILPDDDVKYVRRVSSTWNPGEEKVIFIIKPYTK